MNSIPRDIFSLLDSTPTLTLRDILTLATTNRSIRKMLESQATRDELATHFGFPYGLTLIEFEKYEAMTLNRRLEAAAMIGDMRVVKKAIESGAYYYDNAMMSAAHNGHIDIIEYLIELGADNYYMTIQHAAHAGQMNVVKFLISKGANQYNTVMARAAFGGYKDIIARS